MSRLVALLKDNQLSKLNSDIGSYYSIGKSTNINVNANELFCKLENIPKGRYIVFWKPGYITTNPGNITFNISGGDMIAGGSATDLNTKAGNWISSILWYVEINQTTNYIALSSSVAFACQANGTGLTAVRLK